MQRGLVLSLQRTGGYANVQMADGTVVRAPWLSEFPPCPRSIVWLDQPVPGTYLVVGMEANRRILVHDEFMAVIAGTYGDTNWFAVGFAGTIGSSGGIYGGGIDIVNNGVAFQWFGISKDNNTCEHPAFPQASWYHSRFKLDAQWGSGGQSAHFMGFANNAASNGFGAAAGAAAMGFICAASFATANWYLRAVNGASFTDLDTGIPAVASTDTDIDVVVVGGTAIMGWINGIGPFVNASNVPAASTKAVSAQPVAVVESVAGTFVGVSVDQIHVERISAIRYAAASA